MVNEQAVLDGANLSTSGWNPTKPKIIEFYGLDGEDFRHFKTVLNTFFLLTGTAQDQRRVSILRTQLRRAAAVYFDNSLRKKGLTITHIKYQDAIKILEEQYITSRLIQSYELAFNEMVQDSQESPREFLARLYEAADLAEIDDEKFIHSRFRAGLQAEIKTFCREQSASSFEEWAKHATGWYDAHASQYINLVDNPFRPITKKLLPTGKTPEALLSKTNRIRTQKNLDLESIAAIKSTPVVENLESPTIAALTAKLEALDLKQLVPTVDSRNYMSNDSSLKGSDMELVNSNKSIRSLVKSIVQELMVEDFARDKDESYRRNGKKPFNNYRGGNPRRNQGNMYYDNDNYNPGEGYYRPPYRENDYQGQNNQNRNIPYNNDYPSHNNQNRNYNSGYQPRNKEQYSNRNNGYQANNNGYQANGNNYNDSQSKRYYNNESSNSKN
ncbi:hypothetical protein EDC94DRAFT_668973 [Helicostylum pulchrum]|nr:hypothetical protein EDC94DRAFT_668973 [Helicostylum pulchrum]